MEKMKDYFRVPQELDSKYHGCGNGIVVFDKGTGAILDFDYTDSKLRPIPEQNVAMTKQAGKVVREDDKTITYRCNFSSYQICLF